MEELAWTPFPRAIVQKNIFRNPVESVKCLWYVREEVFGPVEQSLEIM